MGVLRSCVAGFMLVVCAAVAGFGAHSPRDANVQGEKTDRSPTGGQSSDTRNSSNGQSLTRIRDHLSKREYHVAYVMLVAAAKRYAADPDALKELADVAGELVAKAPRYGEPVLSVLEVAQLTCPVDLVLPLENAKQKIRQRLSTAAQQLGREAPTAGVGTRRVDELLELLQEEVERARRAGRAPNRARLIEYDRAIQRLVTRAIGEQPSKADEYLGYLEKSANLLQEAQRLSDRQIVEAIQREVDAALGSTGKIGDFRPCRCLIGAAQRGDALGLDGMNASLCRPTVPKASAVGKYTVALRELERVERKLATQYLKAVVSPEAYLRARRELQRLETKKQRLLRARLLAYRSWAGHVLGHALMRWARDRVWTDGDAVQLFRTLPLAQINRGLVDQHFRGTLSWLMENAVFREINDASASAKLRAEYQATVPLPIEAF